MDDCKRLKDLILTDYVDGEADPAVKNEIESHLSAFGECRRFAEDVQKNLVGSFKAAPRAQVPERVWSAISQQLEGNQLEDETDSFWEKWLKPFLNPKFAPVLAVIIFLVLSGALTFFN